MSILEAINGLRYESENGQESGWGVYTSFVQTNEGINPKVMRSITNSVRCEEENFNTRIGQMIDNQKQNIEYARLFNLLIENLRDIHCFIMDGKDEYNVSIYFVGIDKRNNIYGVYTYATES